MNKQMKYRLRYASSVFILIIYTIFVFFAESTFIPAFGLKMPVYLLIPLTVTVAMNIPDTAALFYGILTGCLFDLISSATDGIYTLMFALSAFVCSSVTKKIFRNSKNVAFLFSVIFTVILSLTSLYFNFITGDKSSILLIIKGFYLPAILVTMLATPIFYPISTAIIGITNERI